MQKVDNGEMGNEQEEKEAEICMDVDKFHSILHERDWFKGKR